MNLGRVSSAALMLSGISAVLTPKQVASALHLSADSDRGVAEARAFWSYLAAEIGFGATALAYATRIEVELSRR